MTEPELRFVLPEKIKNRLTFGEKAVSQDTVMKITLLLPALPE